MVLCSSPNKKGNTNTVANWAIEAATTAGATVEKVNVAGLKYKVNGCIACMKCQQSDQFACVIDDDAQPIITRIPDFDVLLLATPVYFMGLNAQLKLILDRTFALYKFNPETDQLAHSLAGKTLALISTAAGDLHEGLSLLDENIKSVAGFDDRKYLSLLIPHAPMDAAQMADNTEVAAKARAFGKQLAT